MNLDRDQPLSDFRPARLVEPLCRLTAQAPFYTAVRVVGASYAGFVCFAVLWGVFGGRASPVSPAGILVLMGLTGPLMAPWSALRSESSQTFLYFWLAPSLVAWGVLSYFTTVIWLNPGGFISAGPGLTCGCYAGFALTLVHLVLGPKLLPDPKKRHGRDR